MSRYLVLLSLTLSIADAQEASTAFKCQPCAYPHCEMTRPDSEETVLYFGESVGMATCREVQSGIDNLIYSSDQCDHIMKVTRYISDRCMCRDTSTGEDCLPRVESLYEPPCDLCANVGQDYIIGDSDRQIEDTSSIWNGMKCGYLVSLPKLMGFSNHQCTTARLAVQNFCSCHPSDGSVQVEQCKPQEDPSNPCNPNDGSDKCCSGSCKFLPSLQAYVCTTRDIESPSQPISQAAPVPSGPSPTRVPTRVRTSSPVSLQPVAQAAPEPTRPSPNYAPIIWEPIMAPSVATPETFSPIVAETPSPIVAETHNPSVAETPSPIVAETPSPSGAETPSPSIEETSRPTSTARTPVPTTVQSEQPIAINSTLAKESASETSGAIRIPISVMTLALIVSNILW